MSLGRQKQVFILVERGVSMGSVYLDPGSYVNIFMVFLPDECVDVVACLPSPCPSLNDLRKEINKEGWNVRIYKSDDFVLGYGQDTEQLLLKGFRRQELRLLDYPKWCTRLIMEGLTDHLTAQQYRMQPNKGRKRFCEPKPYQITTRGQLNVFRGYDLKVIYWRRDRQPIFGLVVDIFWNIEEVNGRRLNSVEIAQYGASFEVAQIQGEYLPSNRINPEASRLRLQNHILPFVAQHKEFALPLSEGIKVTLNETPIRVILGV